MRSVTAALANPRKISKKVAAERAAAKAAAEEAAEAALAAALPPQHRRVGVTARATRCSSRSLIDERGHAELALKRALNAEMAVFLSGMSAEPPLVGVADGDGCCVQAPRG